MKEADGGGRGGGRGKRLNRVEQRRKNEPGKNVLDVDFRGWVSERTSPSVVDRTSGRLLRVFKKSRKFDSELSHNGHWDLAAFSFLVPTLAREVSALSSPRVLVERLPAVELGPATPSPLCRLS